MLKEDLLQIIEEIRITKCETQTIEIKSAFKGTPKRLYDTLSAFSNQDGGGILIFGINEKEDFSITGVYDTQDLQQRVASQCKEMQPPVRALFTSIKINGKMVVSAEIPGVDVADRPVYYRGSGPMRGSFIRVGDADEPMSDYEIYSYDAYHRRVRDDIRIVEGASLTTLDTRNLDDYIELVMQDKHNLSTLPKDEILNLMGVIKGNEITLSGLLAFSKYPQALFPQLCITAVVVPGTEYGDVGEDNERFISNKRIEGTIAQMLDEAVLFVKRNMQQKTVIDDEGRRKDKWEYPIKALREIILNALMHRDYSIHSEGTPVQLIMYKDRIEIINPGGLYGRLTLDSLGKIHADTRNQSLTHILEVQKTAENRYSGIPTIRKELEMAGMKEAKFESRRGRFVVTLYSENIMSIDTSIHISLDDEIINFCREPRTRKEISEFLNRTQDYAMSQYLKPLLNGGQLKMTIPNSPRSRNQKYYSELLYK